MQTALSQIVHNFQFTPTTARLAAAFGYGSGVLGQWGQSTSGKMIDLIFVADNPWAWHEANMAVHPHHYYWLTRILGPGYANLVQRKLPLIDGIYFNTLVPFDFVDMGVAQDQSAGRLHKPVEWMEMPGEQSSTIMRAYSRNLRSAVAAALISLPETFQLKDLFTAITQLSYQGDPRMGFFEDNKKISNIVNGQYERFLDLYDLILADHKSFHLERLSSEKFQRDLGSKSQSDLLLQLPSNVWSTLLTSKNNLPTNCCPATTREEMAHLLAQETPVVVADSVRRALTHIVKNSSQQQTFKGIFTAGPYKSLKYLSGKMIKAIRSRVRILG